MSQKLSKRDILFIKKLVLKAGKIAFQKQRNIKNIKRKADHSIVTENDLFIQNLLIKKLKKRFKNALFIYEENFNSKVASLTENSLIFIIDPIDGTAMYSMHLPIWCVSIGVFWGEQPLHGFVYAPAADMFFYNDEKNAYLNNNPISVNKNLTVENETNIFYASEFKAIHKINFKGKIRNLGSTALHACLTTDNARNRILAFIGKAFLWDWAGSIPIILKAGGNIRYITGEEINFKDIILNKCKIPEYIIVYNIDDFEKIQKIFQREG